MATLTVTDISLSGITPSYASAAAGGDEFANPDGQAFYHIKNGGVSSVTVTFAAQATVDGLTVSDVAITVPAGEERIVGPFSRTYMNDANGRVQVTYSGVTSVTVAAFRLEPAPS